MTSTMSSNSYKIMNILDSLHTNTQTGYMFHSSLKVYVFHFFIWITLNNLNGEKNLFNSILLLSEVKSICILEGKKLQQNVKCAFFGLLSDADLFP